MIETNDWEPSVFEGILLISREPMAVLKRNGEIIAWNIHAARSLGYDSASGAGLTFPAVHEEFFHQLRHTALLSGEGGATLEAFRRDQTRVVVNARMQIAGPGLLMAWSLNDPLHHELTSFDMEGQLEELGRRVKASESMLRATFETGREVTVLLGEEGNVRYISPNYSMIAEIPPEQIVNGDVTSRIHPDHVNDILEAIREVAEAPGTSVTRQTRVLNAKGRYIWVEATGTNLLHDPDIRAIVVKSRNIEAERTLRDELERREQSLRLALESARMICFEWNFETDEVGFSHDYQAYFGAPPSTENASSRFLAGFHSDDQPRLVELFNGVKSAGGSLNVEVMGAVPLSSGQFPRYQILSRAILDSEGQPVRQLGVVSDITARRLAEENVQLANARLAEAQKLARLGAWGMQLRTWVVWWSDSMYELCGVSKESFTPTYQSIYDHLDNEDKQSVLEMFHQLYLTGEAPPIIARFIKPDGNKVVFSVHVAAERDRRGAMVAVLGTVQDITHQVRDEMEKEILQERVQRQQELESLGILAGGIAHDFNNLLTPILGYTKLAANSLPANSVAHRQLEEVERGVLRAADLCRQMLAYAGRGRFLVGPQNLNEIAQEICQLLETTLAPRAQLHLHLAPFTPVIEADGTQIRQVVMNLLTNASDSMGDSSGDIHISTGLVFATAETLACGFPPSELPAGDYAFIEVRDNGCGMDEQTIERIFEPFFTTKFTGRGLGLAACLGIVRSHSGTILVESQLGAGSCFRILFPPSGADLTLEAPLETVGENNATIARRVLVVDDTAPIREMARSSLESAGSEVILACDGMEALEILREDPSMDAVLLDLTMPRLGGLDTLMQMRREGLRPPVILMSGYSEEELEQKFGHLGFSAFLPKPFGPGELLRTIRTTLSQRIKTPGNSLPTP